MKKGIYRKDQMTPEEWRAHLDKVNAYRSANKDKVNAARREYAARPEVKERRKKHDAKDSHRERRLAHNRKPEIKERAKQRHLERAVDDPTYLKQRSDRLRMYRTGFSPALFDETMSAQSGACAVCKRLFSDLVTPHADHCHTAQKPRGILCRACNTAEGIIRSTGLSADTFGDYLAEYLSKHGAS